jgi:hypothetical protein|tara:strand:- start:142 stop:471 length:330 start_codon:yes stop_codon:yes gene_type:complete
MEIKKLIKNAFENKGTQSAQIKPNGYTTFYGQEGRNYIVALSNMDGDYPATISVYDMDWGNLIETVTIQPFTGKSIMVTMGKGNGVRVYNQSNEPTSGRPEVNASLYHA